MNNSSWQLGKGEKQEEKKHLGNDDVPWRQSSK